MLTHSEFSIFDNNINSDSSIFSTAMYTSIVFGALLFLPAFIAIMFHPVAIGINLLCFYSIISFGNYLNKQRKLGFL